MPTTANPSATTINDSQPGTTTTSSTQNSTVASKLKISDLTFRPEVLDL